MPKSDQTGPIGIGPHDGRGREKGGRGQTSKEKGSGSKTGGQKGECD